MPYFMFFGYDATGGEAIRARVRPDHQAHLKAAPDDCRPVLGGPLVDDDGARMAGTLIVYEAADRAAVERFVARDPYTLEKLFERTFIRRWQWGLGAPDAAA